MLEPSPILAALLLVAVTGVACLYSSVGHGGATGYLAVMALAGVGPTLARPGALWMNCVVASIAYWRFQRAGFFDLRLFVPLAAASVPLAWLGSRLQPAGWVGPVILGVALLAGGWLLGWGCRDEADEARQPVRLPVALATGGGLGLLAGMTGIGGGVFLTPVLILQRWTSARTAGGISALFILLNSAAGLAGLGRQALIWEPAFLASIPVGVAGALVGAHLGVKRWHATGFRRALAVVLWIAAVKLLLTGK